MFIIDDELAKCMYTKIIILSILASMVHRAREYSQLAAISVLTCITANIFIPTLRPLCTKYRFGVYIKPRPNISHTKSHQHVALTSAAQRRINNNNLNLHTLFVQQHFVLYCMALLVCISIEPMHT